MNARLCDMAAAQARALCKVAIRLEKITITPYGCVRSGNVCSLTEAISNDRALGQELNERLRKRGKK